MLTPQQQLSDVAKQVKQWQQTKAHRNSALPEKLRQQILPLFEYFTNSEKRCTKLRVLSLLIVEYEEIGTLFRSPICFETSFFFLRICF